VLCAGRHGIQTGFLRDLSPGGIFVRILDPEPAGRRLGFEIALVPGRDPLRGEGEVVWSRAVYEAPGRPPGMAVRFLALEPAALAAFTELLGCAVDVSGVGMSTDGAAPAGLAAVSEELLAPLPEPAPAGEAAALLAPDVLSRASYEATEDEAGPPEAGKTNGTDQTDQTDQTDGSTRVSIPSARRPFWRRPIAWVAAVGAGVALGTLLAPDGQLGPVGDDRPAVAESSPGIPPSAATTADDVMDAADQPSPALPAATSVTGVRWELGAGATVVVVGGDGGFSADRVRWSHIGGAAPRAVVEVRDVSRANEARRWDVGSPQLESIRTGYHTRDGRGDLHVVLDLAGPGIEVVDVVPSGDEILIYVASV